MIEIKKLNYSRSPWRVLWNGAEVEFAHFERKRDAKAWLEPLRDLPWQVEHSAWPEEERRRLSAALRASPGFRSWATAVGRAVEIGGV